MMPRLCSVETVCCQGHTVFVEISQHTATHFTAETAFAYDDRIITDGKSEEETLRCHYAVLPLALMARQLGVGDVLSLEDSLTIAP